MSETKTVKQRNEIPEEYKWRLEDIFETDEAWEKEYDETMAMTKELSSYAGRLGEKAETLLAFFKLADDFNYHLQRVYVYANMRSHQDTAVTKYQAYAAKADDLAVAASSAISFMEPEILAIPDETLKGFMEQEELKHYTRFVNEILRGKAHTLTPAEEAILAEVGNISVGPSNIYSMFNNADIKFPIITDTEGNKIQVTHGNYIQLMENKDRSVRHQAFEALYHTYAKFANTITATYVSHLKQDLFYTKARHFDTTREKHMFSGNVPTSVYDNLIETVHKHLPAMHRYVSLRKKILGVDKLHMYDLYVPLVEDASDHNYSIEEAKELCVKALAPMGEEYLAILKEGFENGWIDVFENANKRSGAYSWGCYGTHPYVFLNHSGTLDSVFTLAHEMGHAIHSYYSNKTQSVTYCEYLIFVAEVASTCNESLLAEYLLGVTEDKAERKNIINQKLESFRGTLFRQTMFAEFEKIVHERLQAGESMTKDDLNKIYHDLNVLYYGPDMEVDEEIDFEWMRIPHFYTAFYVYQYATGISAATAFSKKILEEGKPAVDRYVSNFLCGGGSKDPIDLLKDAGVDMSSPEPVDAALQVFEEYLDLFEKEF